MDTFAGAVLLLIATVALSALARRLRLPAPVLLAVAGVVVAAVPGVPAVEVAPEVVQLLVLPALLFAAALELPVREVRAQAGSITALALGLVLVSAVGVAAVALQVVPGVGSAAALALGAMLAATDPVAVAALSRRLPLPRRLLTLVSSESLLNDATSLVLYRVAVAAVVAGTGVPVARAAGQFVLIAGIGVLAGLLVGVLVARLTRLTDDSLVAGALGLLTPYAAYLLAEEAHGAGLMAVVTCGLVLSAATPVVTSSTTRLRAGAVWELVVFLLEGAVFLLIGLLLPGLLEDLPAGQLGGVLGQGALLVVALLALRVGWIVVTGYLPLALAARRSADRQPPSVVALAVVVWTGTRGVVALAAALALPLELADGRPFLERDRLIVLTTLVVVVTLVVQGLTLGPLARRLDVGEEIDAGRRGEAAAQERALVAARARLDELLEGQSVPPEVAERLRRSIDSRLAHARDRLRAEPASAEHSSEELHRRLRLALVEAERAELLRLRARAEIAEPVLRRLLRDVDLQEARLLNPDP